MTVENAPVASKTEAAPTQPAGSNAEATQTAKDNSAAAQARIAFEAKEAKYKADLDAANKELATLRNKGKSADELLAERVKEVEQYGKERESLTKERDTFRTYADEALKPRVDALPKELQETLGLIGDYDAKLKALKNFEAITKTTKAPVQGGVVPTTKDAVLGLDAKMLNPLTNPGGTAAAAIMYQQAVKQHGKPAVDKFLKESVKV